LLDFKKNRFQINKKDFLNIYLNKKVFEPNLTTSLLIEASKKIIKKNNAILDLGCGSGVIGCFFLKKKVIRNICSSDISSEAIKCSIYNYKSLKANFDIRKGKNINIWKGSKFDVIINDIAGISSKLNKITDWYKHASNNSGPEGVKFTLDILDNYRKFLKKNGKLIFPVISLSNKKKITDYLKKNKISHKVLLSKEWPLPSKLNKNIEFLRYLKKKNLINFEEKFNLIIGKTEIFCCS
jgi:methylase of polypeptide subunit release factors